MRDKTMRWRGLFYRQPGTGRLHLWMAIELVAEPDGGWFRVSGTSKPLWRRGPQVKRGRNQEKVA